MTLSRRILHLLPSCSSQAAGLASAVEGLCKAQVTQGLSPAIQAADAYPLLSRTSELVAAAHPATSDAVSAELIHSHGLWLAPSRASLRLRRRGLPTVVAPHGMLDPWAWRRRRTLKQLLWWATEQRTVQHASCLQALCRAEVEAIRQLGISTPVALIPNGVVLPDRSPTALEVLPPAPWLAHGVPAEAPVLLFLGRFHAKKGLYPLLQAWQALQGSQASSAERPWLVFAGFGDGGALANQLLRFPVPHVCVVGALHGSAKASAYAHATGFVLPSFSEGLPMAALEAMSWGLPCLLSRECNLSDAFHAQAAWEAPPDAKALLPVLQHWSLAAGKDIKMLQAMGASGRILMAKHYSWNSIATATADLYSWILDGGPTPDFVGT